MKKIYSFILTALLLLGAQCAWTADITSDGSNRLFVKNIKPGDWTGEWKVAGVKMYATFSKGGTTSAAVEASLFNGTEDIENSIYMISIPSGSWSSVTLYRGASVSTTDYYNKTSDMSFSAGKNYLTNYFIGDPSWDYIYEFSGTEKIYFRNISTGSIGSAKWKDPSGKVYAYFFNETDNTWSDEALLEYGNADADGAIYSVIVPEGAWAGMILTRGTGSGWNGQWNGTQNQTTDIALYDYKYTRKYLVSYQDKNNGGGYSWATAPFCLTGIFQSSGESWDLYINPFDEDNEITVSLAANQKYDFKVTSMIGASTALWYGTKAEGYMPLKASDSSEEISNTNGAAGNCEIYTSIAGDYKFTWNDANHTITVTYPTEFPSRSIGVGNWGTICLPVDATIEGADLYSISSVSASAVTVLPETGENAHMLTAGQPYFIKGTSDTQTITLLNTAFEENPGTNNGLVGKYAHFDIPEGKYMLYNNQIYLVGTGCYIDAYYAYLDINPSGTAPTAIRIDEGVNNTTSVNNIEASEKAVKFFENGQMYIQHNGVTYDMTGRAVK